MGGACGYLALMSGLASGAERPGAHRIDTGRPVAAIADETTRLYRRAVPEAE